MRTETSSTPSRFAGNRTGRRSKNLDAASLDAEIGNPDIRAVMTVISPAAALIVAHLGGSVVINVILDEAGHSQFASNRQTQRDFVGGLGRSNRNEADRRKDKSLEANDASVIERILRNVARHECKLVLDWRSLNFWAAITTSSRLRT